MESTWDAAMLKSTGVKEPQIYPAIGPSKDSHSLSKVEQTLEKQPSLAQQDRSLGHTDERQLRVGTLFQLSLLSCFLSLQSLLATQK